MSNEKSHVSTKEQHPVLSLFRFIFSFFSIAVGLYFGRSLVNWLHNDNDPGLLPPTYISMKDRIPQATQGVRSWPPDAASQNVPRSMAPMTKQAQGQPAGGNAGAPTKNKGENMRIAQPMAEQMKDAAERQRLADEVAKAKAEAAKQVEEAQATQRGAEAAAEKAQQEREDVGNSYRTTNAGSNMRIAQRMAEQMKDAATREQKPKEAEPPEEIRKDAEQGDAEAQYNLGIFYVAYGLAGIMVNDGDKHDDDFVEAIKWFSKAAEQGHAKAQFVLGSLYEEGLEYVGFQQDKTEAVKWYHMAAKQGNENAKEALKRLGQ